MNTLLICFCSLQKLLISQVAVLPMKVMGRHEDIFSSVLLMDLVSFYTMLYSNCSIQCCFPYFVRCSCVTVDEQLIGSVMNSRCAKSSLVINAYWPTKECDFQSINYSGHMSFGIIQYFCNHEVVVCRADNTEQKLKHIFAYVQWKQKHQNEDWFDISATVLVPWKNLLQHVVSSQLKGYTQSVHMLHLV